MRSFPSEHDSWFVASSFRHTPKHGSWLNIAENELSSLTRQCIAGRLFGDVDTLREDTLARSSCPASPENGMSRRLGYYEPYRR